jgi:hypothetical protein
VSWAREQQQWWPFGKSRDPDMGLLARFTERRDVAWSPNAATGNAVRSRAPQTLRTEVEACGLCHGRRSQLSEGWVPGHSLSDTHQVSPLGRGLYQPDGQMLDEVYNYGSFKQSKMFAVGVTCSDDPLAASARRLRRWRVPAMPRIRQVRRGLAPHHERADPKLTCASCHMPSRTYMVIDPRHDHSFRVPRPDLSQKLNTTNTCNDCHTDKKADWAAAAIERWHGPNRKGFQSYGEGFHAAWNGGADAARLLGRRAGSQHPPSRVRCARRTRAYLSPGNIDLARGPRRPDRGAHRRTRHARRRTAESTAAGCAAVVRSVRTVRIRAASLLAAMPADSRPSTASASSARRASSSPRNG